MVDFYCSPAQMEPLIIDETRPPYRVLTGLAHELSEASSCLDAAVVSSTAHSLSELVAGMNCYYSNLIEGHKTLPLDIEQALRTTSHQTKNLQNLAAAHIQADRWAKAQSLSGEGLEFFLLEVHRIFCQHLPQSLLQLSDAYSLIPGQFRTREVQVGRHLAPRSDHLKDFLARYVQVYGQRLLWAQKNGIAKLDGIVSSFAAHHRLAWIHPFLDGNGRVARIALDAMLRSCGINGASLWSMSRGFAKTADEYKSFLAGADAARQGDLDGRGNLSERGLADFCSYAMQTAIDQAKFMARMFALDNFKARVDGYFHRVRFDLKPESAYLYLHAFAMGEFERGEAGRITGLAERTARNILRDLVAEGFLVSDSPKGKVRVGFPVQALGSLLPNLYPAGDTDPVQ